MHMKFSSALATASITQPIASTLTHLQPVQADAAQSQPLYQPLLQLTIGSFVSGTLLCLGLGVLVELTCV